MATIDISRNAFEPRKHYTGVRMQQGRVITDDDWNENERIENEDRRRARVDIIGPHGSPDEGFRIANPRITDDDLIDFDIGAGTFYLGGLRLDMEESEEPGEQETFRTQKDYLLQRSDLSDEAPNLPRFDLVYLKAWQQPVSAVEDSELFEVALGGPDTSMRLRNMRQVLIHPNVETNDCGLAWKSFELGEKFNPGGLDKEHESTPDTRLIVSFVEPETGDDLCAPSVAGGYLGAENQAIRVQLVGGDYFTWGFDNAAPLYRVQVNEDGDTVTLLTDPKDEAHWPLSGQIVEILPCSAMLPNGEKLAGMWGHLSKIDSSYNPDTGKFTLKTSLDEDFKEWTSQRSEYLYMRVWNRGSDITSAPKIHFSPEGDPVPLGNTGLKVTITGDDRITGDYWIIAARPETPNKIVPWELEEGIPPHGFRRFFAPLAVIQWKYNNKQQIEGEVVHDCRKRFRPLTDQQTCCTCTVGDGVHSQGDFNSIEEAIRNLPEGGKICVLPGRHYTNVTIDQQHQIKIVGCGFHTIVHPTDKGQDQPIFLIKTSERISIENMTLVTSTGTAIQVKDHQNIQKASREIFIEKNHIIALTHAIDVRVYNELGGNNDIRIANNEIVMFNMAEGEAAIFCLADNVVIERNRIGVLSAPDPDDTNDPREPGPGDDIFELCADLFKLYAAAYPIYDFIHSVFLFLDATNFFKQIPYLAQGGIQIGGGSEWVKIVGNRIIGGNGNGVTLGHVPSMEGIWSAFKYKKRSPYFVDKIPEEGKSYLKDNMVPELYAIAIEDNMIQNMGLSGIGLPVYFNLKEIGLIISIEDLTVYRNTITQCAHLLPVEHLQEMEVEAGFGGIVLGACENAVIQENRIENNGLSQLEPVCGILILYGEKIDVSKNRILNNGTRTSTNDNGAKSGFRGGIVIATSFTQIRSNQSEGAYLSPDGIPAVKIHNNIVTQPLGQALFIIAFGPVSVIGNHLTSQGAAFSVSSQGGVSTGNYYSLLAATVFILNLGISKDLIMFLLLSKLKGVTKSSFRNSNIAMVQIIAGVAGGGQLVDLLQKILYLPSGNVLFANNQTTLDLRSKDFSFAFSSQLIVSLDDIAYNSNQSECTSLIDLLLTNVALLGVTIRSNDNRFQEGITVALSSLFSHGYMNMATTNQATHCLQVFGVEDLSIKEANTELYGASCSKDAMKIEEHLGIRAIFGLLPHQ